MKPGIVRWLCVFIMPLLLASCLTPGRFTARLEVGRDRSFTFTYIGEAVFADPGSSIRISTEGDASAKMQSQQPSEISEADRQRVIEALSREVGYNRVEYAGANKFRIDYSISGRLDRSFAFPVNPEGMALLPWVIAEVRRDNSIQVTAGGFGDAEAGPQNQDDAEATRHRQGSFTLSTDADLVRHNSEQASDSGGRHQLVWEVTPAPRPAPAALLRLAD